MTEIANETDNLELRKQQAFVEPDETEIAGLKLRPLSAGTLIQLKLTDNALVDGRETKDGEFQIASFIYIHAGDPKEVRKAVLNIPLFKEKVLEFTETITIKDFIKTAGTIQKLIENAVIGQDYEVKQKDDAGIQSPNS